VSPDGQNPYFPPESPYPLSAIPFPTEVPIASPGEKVLVYVLPDLNLSSVNFGKLMLLNKNSGEEKVLVSSVSYSRYDTQIGIGYELIGALPAPSEPGLYEFDLYYNNSVVASASFQVMT